MFNVNDKDRKIINWRHHSPLIFYPEHIQEVRCEFL